MDIYRIKLIVTFFIRYCLNFGHAEDDTGTLVLLCKAEVFEVVSHLSDGEPEYHKLYNISDSLFVNFDNQTIFFLEQSYYDYEVLRDHQGIIVAGPSESFTSPDGQGGGSLIDTTLLINPYTGSFYFFPASKKFDRKIKKRIYPMGSLLYEGSCEKSGPRKF